MKKIVIITLVLIVSLIIGVLGILTAMKLTSGKPVAPNAPEIKPRAEGVSPTTPPSACTVTFTLNPTSTPTPGPSATPTLTLTPTLTPTPVPNAPSCSSLSASPTSGDAPLVVSFVASGFADSSGFISGFEFTFGDGATKNVDQTFHTTDSYTITHSYANPGSYVATVRIKDNNGNWSSIPDACKQTITVKGPGPTSTPVPTNTPAATNIPAGPTNTPGPQAKVLPSPTSAVAVPQVPVAGNVIPAIITISSGILLFVVGWLVL